MVRAVAAGLVALLLTGASSAGASAQQAGEDSVSAETSVPEAAEEAGAAPAARQQGRCTLTLEPEEETVLQRYSQGEDTYITHVGGGMTWRCGTAVMQGDSAVKYDVGRRVEMIGSVRYRDTIRTLRSQRLTYYEIQDRVLATGDVLLTRLASGSTLRAPRVEFLRAVSGVNERTIAEGRPHMTLYTDSARRAPPFEVDADRTEFAGEEIAEAWGDVVIERPDVRATADSAYFDLAGGSGILYGDPWARGEGFELTGDTIRLGFEGEELREVRAIGDGEALGEDYRVRAARIDAFIREEKVDAVWAHGPGRSLAISRPYRLLGDSLRFALSDGQMDTVVAVGRAIAVEEDTAAAGADTVPAAADAVPAGADTLAAEADTVPAGIDTVAAGADTLGAEGPDTLAAEPPGPPRRGPLRGRTEAGADSARGPEAGPAAPEIQEPRLAADADRNWMVGDTLYALFSEPADDPREGDSAAAVGESEGAAADAGERPPEAEGGDPSADEEEPSPDIGDAPGAAGPTPPDSAARRTLSRLRILAGEGRARAYYVLQDSTGRRTGARNYLIGRTIEVLFRRGRPDRVIGTRAIGVYLDPSSEAVPAAPAEGTAPPDTAGVRDSLAADTAAVRDSLPPDTAAIRDSLPPDTAAIRDTGTRLSAAARVAAPSGGTPEPGGRKAEPWRPFRRAGKPSAPSGGRARNGWPATGGGG